MHSTFLILAAKRFGPTTNSVGTQIRKSTKRKGH